MGCYNPAKSDIDLIIVVKDSIEDSVKRVFMDMVVELNEKGPAKGIEMSVVKQSACKPFVYPTPFELHFSVAHLDWYGKNLDDYVSKMKGEDKDLAAHFTIIIIGASVYMVLLSRIFLLTYRYRITLTLSGMILLKQKRK